jgi:hypothetical protein
VPCVKLRGGLGNGVIVHVRRRPKRALHSNVQPKRL